MGNLQSLLFGFEGRIPRSRFWLGVVIMIVAGIIVSFILGSILGVSYFNMNMPTSGGDAQAMADEMMATTTRSGWASLISFLIFVYPMGSLIIKRRHDRGKSGNEFWVYAVLTVIAFLLQGTGMGYQMTEMAGISMATPTLVMSVLLFIIGIMGLYLFIVCGFLKGNEGDNAYGPDPLANT